MQRTGFLPLQFWKQAGLQLQLTRNVGTASKIFPDPSALQGSEWQTENAEIGKTSGMPTENLGRVATIYAPSRTASQQGQSKTASHLGKGPAWKIEFEVKQKWQNPLIGWTSTADPFENVARSALNFSTKEAAIAFAEKNGFQPVVREPNVRRPDRQKRFAGYGDNFSVKRHGYPVGGMRSESPLKKQPPTEEMHLEPQTEPEAVKEQDKPKKAARGRPKKADS